MSDFFDDVIAQAFTFGKILQDLGINTSMIIIEGTKFIIGGDIQSQDFHHPIREVKHEKGSKGTQPHI